MDSSGALQAKGLTDKEMRKKVQDDADFVALPRYGYSLEKALEAHPDGCPDRLIAQALMITEAEVRETYEQILVKFRALLRIND